MRTRRPVPSLALVGALLAGSASAQDFDPNYAGTYSIIGLDPATGELGMAVQSKAFAVGNRTVTGKGGLVVLAHQASSNPMYGALAVPLVQAGLSPKEALDQILRSDPDRERRQVAILDIHGAGAAFTGSGASDWKGHTCGMNYCAQGNSLAGPAVVEQMAKTFETTKGPLVDRLVAALEAAQAGGGDARGMQAASVTIFKPLAGASSFSDRMIDLRVDDSREPLAELRRLLNIYWSGQMITEGNTLINAGKMDEGIEVLMAARDRSPGNDNAWVALASAYIRANRKADALSAVAKAIEINPSSRRQFLRNTNFKDLQADPDFLRLVGN
jgi:uncharacterized Ntn-hydrolase superfamily protein